MLKKLLAAWCLVCAAVKLPAAVLLIVDIGNLSNVTITGTGEVPPTDLTSSGYRFPIVLQGFYNANPGQNASPVNLISSTLKAGGDGDYLDQLLMGRSEPGLTSLVLRIDATSSTTVLSSDAAFDGQAAFDFVTSATANSNPNSISASFLPAYGHVGNVVLKSSMSSTEVIGTYTVVPEPSTYAFAGGLACAAFAVWRRRLGQFPA